MFGNRVKLIKRISLGQYQWNSTYNNTWSSSTLNVNTLNGTYLNGLGTTWNNMIETTTWKVGGVNYSYLMYETIKTAYDYEIGNNSSSTTYSAKICLMYVSDYGYAASPENWAITLNAYNNSTNTSNNWLFLGSTEWTITSWSGSGSRYVFNIDGTESVSGNDFVAVRGFVRPSFYLKSNIAITSGDGSQNSPFRLILG